MLVLHYRLTRALLGYSRTLPAFGGGGASPSYPAICQTTGPILDLKTEFDSPGYDLSHDIEKISEGH